MVSDEEVISLSHAELYVFSDSVLCLGKNESEPNIKFSLGRKMSWFQNSSQYRVLDTIDGEPMEFEWNIFQGFTTLQLCNKVQEFMFKMGDPSLFKGRITFMTMFNDILWGSEDNERECNATADFVSFFCKKIPTRTMVISRTWIRKEVVFSLNRIDRPQGEWNRVAELMMIKFGESGHPVFRATSPLSRGTFKSKGGGKLSIHFYADGETIEIVFRTKISVNQLSIYGAVSDLCDEYRSLSSKNGETRVGRTI